VTIVVAGAGVSIEVTVLLAGGVVLARNSAEIGVFGVVAGAQALWVCRIDQAILIVVGAVPASIELSVAIPELAGPGSA
jgi:hypothetical protein